MQWNKKSVSYMKQELYQVQHQEQTLELRLPEGMPEIGNVLCVWGQSVVRSKEWRMDSMMLSGGIHAWVLYTPEDSQEPQTAECWLPFQIKWNLPESRREGVMRVQCMVRSMDARALSARKLMVRGTVSVQAEAMEMAEETVFTPEGTEEEVQLLEKSYPMRLAKEAGEKLFLLDEEMGTAYMPEKLIAWDVVPCVTEENAVGDKVVLKGNVLLHLVYMANDGKLHAEYLDLPFSQFAELEGMYDKEASVNTVMAVSSVEPEIVDGKLRMKCALIAQYIVSDVENITVAEDAYCPLRTVEVTTEPLTLQCCLEETSENLQLRTNLQDISTVIDVCFRPEFPVLYPEGEQISAEISGMFQVLGYDGEGKLGCVTQGASQQPRYPVGDGCELCLQLQPSDKPEVLGNELIGPLHMDLRACCKQSIPMITDLEVGEEKTDAQDRPSLILRRMEDGDLWALAKASGSTVEAIRKANGLSGEPAPGQMLLIPVC